MSKEIIKNWEKATQDLAKTFVKEYFKEADYWWVKDVIGDIFCVAHYHFSVERMLEALKHNATRKQLIEFYDYELEKFNRGESVKINFVHFLKQ